MRLISSLSLFVFCLYSILPSPAAAETLALWNGHSLEHLQPELQKFREMSGHQVVQQHFRADLFRDKVMSSVLLPELYFIPSDQLSNQQEYRLGTWPASIAQKHGLRKDGYINGQWYGLPINMGNQLVLYYRKDKVKSVSTFEAIPDGRLSWPVEQAFWFFTFLTANHGWPLGQGGFTLNTPAMVTALDDYKKALKRFPSARCELMCNEQDFIRGDVDYLIDGDWAYQMLHDVLGDKLGVAVLPTLNGQPMKPLSSSYVLAIRGNISPAKRKIAEELANYLLSEETQARLYERSKLFPAVPKVGDSMEARMSADMKVLHQQLQASLAMPNDRNMLIVWLVMGKVLKLYLDDEYTAQEAADVMQKMALEGQNQ